MVVQAKFFIEFIASYLMVHGLLKEFMTDTIFSQPAGKPTFLLSVGNKAGPAR